MVLLYKLLSQAHLGLNHVVRFLTLNLLVRFLTLDKPFCEWLEHSIIIAIKNVHASFKRLQASIAMHTGF